MRHVVLRNPLLSGWEYGMLRALENEIVLQTGARIVEMPSYGWQPVLQRSGHGMRLSGVRKWLLKKELEIDADVLWCILMGPENFTLDLYNGWQKAKHRIVYLFDTLPPQYPVIRELFSGNNFTTRITSFADAKNDLEKISGQPWHAVEQAGTDGLFRPAPFEEKVIHFSSYGRRWPAFHEALQEFCRENGLYYDFTTHDGRHPAAPTDELYRQYAWHLNHSLFTVSWPVELTNAARAAHLHPVTCRWFEAACSGTVILGRKPGNPLFDNYLFNNAVVDLDPLASKEKIKTGLAEIWSRRESLSQYAFQNWQARQKELTWTNRVNRMLQLLT